MSFVDCIIKEMQEGMLSEFEARDIQRRYEQAYDEAKSRGLSDSDAELSGMERMATDYDLQAQAQSMMATQRIALHKINEYMRDSGLSPVKAAEKYLQTVADRKAAVFNRAMSIMTDETLNAIGPNFLGATRDETLVKAALGRIIEGRYDNTTAGRIAKNLNEINQALVVEYKLAGLNLKELDNYVPPTHNKAKMTTAGKEAWVNDMKRLVGEKTRTDANTGQRMSEEKLSELLSDAFDSITTGHKALKAELLDMGRMIDPGYAGLLRKRNKKRFIHFDNAEAYFEYNSKYGRNDESLGSMYLSNLSSMSNDIAIADRLGPVPQTSIKYIKEKINISEKPGGLRGKQYQLQKVQDQFEFLYGYALDPDSKVDMIAANLLDLQRTAQLGMAGLSAIPDAGLLRSAAYLRGADANRILMLYGRALFAKGGLPKAARASMIADSISQVFHSGDRMSGVMGETKSFFSGSAKLTNKMSFLNAITTAGKQAGVLETLATSADTAGIKWSKLDSYWRQALIESGVNERQWTQLNKFKDPGLKKSLSDPKHGEAQFLNTDALREHALKSKNFDLLELSNNIDSLAQNMAILGTNEGTLATKAIVTGKRMNSPVLGRMLFQYQNFPLSVLFNHLIPHLEKSMTLRGAKNLGDTFVVTTLLGYASIIAKDVFSGKTKPQIFDEEEGAFGYLDKRTMMRAIIQGGAASYITDLLDLEYGGYKNTVAETLLREFTINRPVPSLMAKGLEGALGAKNIGYAFSEGDDDAIDDAIVAFKKEAGRLMIRNVPFGNVFYLRAALDMMIFDRFRQLTDEDYEENRDKFLERLEDSNQSLWIDSKNKRADVDALLESFRE